MQALLAALGPTERAFWDATPKSVRRGTLEWIKTAKTALVFVNTRMQAEFVFQALWDLHEDGLAIARRLIAVEAAGGKQRQQDEQGEGSLGAQLDRFDQQLRGTQ